jgi:hypothetical protein
MIQSPHITKIPSERPRGVFIFHKQGDRLHRGLETLLGGQVASPPVSITNSRGINRLHRGLVALLDAPERRPPVAPPPDGLRTPAEAARKLHCSVKTLNGHVASGALKYVAIGHGKRRPRRMFTDPDLNEFIANQTRKDVPCPSTKTETVARRTGTSTSKCEVIGFTARRNARRAVKPKK